MNGIGGADKMLTNRCNIYAASVVLKKEKSVSEFVIILNASSQILMASGINYPLRIPKSLAAVKSGIGMLI